MKKIYGGKLIQPLMAAGVFLLLTIMYFLPQLQGKVIQQSDIIQVGKKSRGHHHGGKHYNKHYNKHYKYHGGKHWKGGRYYHGGRYWGHRYYYRPWNWQALGCVVVGPVWYCP